MAGPMSLSMALLVFALNFGAVAAQCTEQSGADCKRPQQEVIDDSVLCLLTLEQKVYRRQGTEEGLATIAEGLKDPALPKAFQDPAFQKALKDPAVQRALKELESLPSDKIPVNIQDVKGLLFHMLPNSLAETIWNVVEEALLTEQNMHAVYNILTKFLPASLAQAVWDALQTTTTTTTSTYTTATTTTTSFTTGTPMDTQGQISVLTGVLPNDLAASIFPEWSMATTYQEKHDVLWHWLPEKMAQAIWDRMYFPPLKTTTTTISVASGPVACPKNYPICAPATFVCIISECSSPEADYPVNCTDWTAASGPDVDPAGTYNYISGIDGAECGNNLPCTPCNSDYVEETPIWGYGEPPPNEWPEIIVGMMPDNGQHSKIPHFSFRAVCAELIGMTLFVWIGCGSAMSIGQKEGSAWVLQVSLAFGLAFTVLAFAIGHYSGAHLNAAVSLSFLVSARIGPGQFFCNVAAQMLGSVLGALILEFTFGPDRDCTGGLATNAIAEGWTKSKALVGEIMGTFLLVYVEHENLFNTRGPRLGGFPAFAPLAIGLSVFVAHCVLIPIDGCSINPTRSFGPALVCSMTRKGSTPWKDHWIFWVGPIIGALLGSLIYCFMRPAY